MRIIVPKVEFIRVDLEFGGRHNPVGSGVQGVYRVDVGGVGGVVEMEVKVDEAVATQNGGQGFFVSARLGIFRAKPNV